MGGAVIRNNGGLIFRKIVNPATVLFNIFKYQ